MAAPSPSAGDADGEGEAEIPVSGMNGHAYSSETEGDDCGAAGDGQDDRASDSVDGDDVFEVEQILDVKTEEGNVLYKVRWKGYSSDDDTWEPEVHLQDCKEVLLEFRNRLAERARQARRENTQNEMTPSTSGAAQVSQTPQSQSSLASPGPCADSEAGIAENHQRGSQTCQLRGRPPPPSKEE